VPVVDLTAALLLSAGVENSNLCLMLEPQQGGTYEQFLSLALTAESAGFAGVFRSDHLATIGGEQREALEAWTTLAALARDTRRVRLGTMVSPMTFRQPAVLAKEAQTVDHLSDGRVELGLGAGWYEAEHVAMGIPFPTTDERMQRLEQGMELIASLLNPSAGAEPAHHIPLILGGQGGPRSARLAARLADEYNTTVYTPHDVKKVFATLRSACEQQQRDPATLRMSWMGTCIVAGTDTELNRRAEEFAERMLGGREDGAAVVTRLHDRGVVGTYDDAATSMRAYIDAGCQRLYLRVLNLDDPEMLLEIADEVTVRVIDHAPEAA
jgi:alkanesulfonate monooxygenase SsuD/methylene tetrahydromethanopterin reductase-like flavin-dependent oxidoreductase (luciferase family)